jgi:hypothetical protein
METNLTPPSTALSSPRDVSPGLWNMIQSIAPTVHQSRMFAVASPEQAQMIMLKGYELGLPLTAAFEFIHIVQNRPTLSPRGALALIQQSGLLAELQIEDTPDACTVTMQRLQPRFSYSCSFSLEDAKRASLIKPDGAWTSYPANMLRWRAIGFCADVVFPDVLAGMKRADEFGATIDLNGDVIQEVTNA